MINLAAYFKHIGYHGASNPSLENLQKIHRAHLMRVPFENLNIHIPRLIILEENLLFEKIVGEKRGGFCFEQNGLFAAVLRELGYSVQRLEGNVYNQERDDFSVPMNHMTLLVQIEGRSYLADVGFGASFIEPLELDNPEIQVQDVGRFKIEQRGDHAFLWEALNGTEELKLAYRFYFVPHELSDYTEACEYMQHAPESNFRKKRVCSQWKADGRYTVSDRNFIYTEWDGTRHETPIQGEEEFHALLQEHFGIGIRTESPIPTP